MNPKPTAARTRKLLGSNDIADLERNSETLRRNYKLARQRLGLSMANRRSAPRFSPKTTMSWKFRSFEECYRWAWEEYIRVTETTPAKRALTMAQLISRVFGIALADIRGPTRDATVVMPRMIGMAMLRFDGLNYAEIRRAFNKDQKTAAYAAVQMSKYTETLDARVDRRGHPFVSESPGCVPSQIPEVASGDRDQTQAEADSADGGLDGGKGPASSDSSQ